jgi:hypothetical protein
MTDQFTLTGTVDPLHDAISWSKANPDGWKAIIDWAHQDRAAGIPPSTRTYLCILRRPHFAGRLGLRRCSANLLLNDHLSSSLARLLNRKYPDLKCPVRAARSDGYAAVGGEAS